MSRTRLFDASWGIITCRNTTKEDYNIERRQENYTPDSETAAPSKLFYRIPIYMQTKFISIDAI